MHKETIKFVDYEGVERIEEHLFNMNKAELTKWLTTTGEATLDKVLLRLTKERNGKAIIEIFENLLRTCYGKKSDDGRKFIKSEEIWNDFYQTEAYSNLFMQLIGDAKKTTEFIKDTLPKEVCEEIGKAIVENKDGIPAELLDYVAAPTT